MATSILSINRKTKPRAENLAQRHDDQDRQGARRSWLGVAWVFGSGNL
ncbi:hypothetical protein [Brytella acorum]|uniref:Uncharacterized protein n=1 Tax=Brytella acorum TaxID=2959299 RepID=A0AA35UHE0_9PROT|nr:hypothetical protein [Brytella acorum]CAI9121386.1 hypothetical protein LMG32879_002233 [Brytella acorum]